MHTHIAEHHVIITEELHSVQLPKAQEAEDPHNFPFKPVKSFAHRLNLKYNISNTWKSSALFKVQYSVLFVLWCFFSQTLCKNQGTALALKSLSELLKTELLFKTRQKNLNPETPSQATALFSEVVKFSPTPHQPMGVLDSIKHYCRL